MPDERATSEAFDAVLAEAVEAHFAAEAAYDRWRMSLPRVDAGDDYRYSRLFDDELGKARAAREREEIVFLADRLREGELDDDAPVTGQDGGERMIERLLTVREFIVWELLHRNEAALAGVVSPSALKWTARTLGVDEQEVIALNVSALAKIKAAFEAADDDAR